MSLGPRPYGPGSVSLALMPWNGREMAARAGDGNICRRCREVAPIPLTRQHHIKFLIENEAREAVVERVDVTGLYARCPQGFEGFCGSFLAARDSDYLDARACLACKEFKEMFFACPPSNDKEPRDVRNHVS